MEEQMQRVGYDVFLMFWRIVISIFFREIRPRGAFNVPSAGPLILVAAPHHNQFLDPLLLMSETYRETRRRARCLIAAKSMQRKVVGFFAKMQGSIPVARAADAARKGSGLISLADDDPCILLGQATKFSTELSPKNQILLPNSANSATAEVVEIISDTVARIKREFGGDNAKRTTRIREKIKECREAGIWGLEYQVLPYINQQEMYSNVYKTLKEGGCIGIFPEGGSHDRTDLLPLKVGVTVMALGAMANDPTLQVQIVPVGLSYFHAHRFRSRAVVEFGSCMQVPVELVDLFKLGGDKKRDACGKLMDMIYDGLKTVTLRTPDYETLMLIQAARRLYKTPGQHLTLGQVVELNKRFMEGYAHFKDVPRVQALRENVLKYNRLVRDLGLRDHQVPRARKATWKTLGLTLYRIGLLIVWTCLALPGVILNGPIFVLASVISRRKARKALAVSTVKIAGRDVLATWKVLVSLGAAPGLYGFYSIAAAGAVTQFGAPARWRVLAPIITLIALPCIGYGALKFGEAGLDVFKSLRPLILSLLPGQQRQLDRLKARRTELSNELSEVVNEFGPRLYDDFDQWRILVPSASVPPSSLSSGLWRRKTNTGAVDAQGNLLVHPMTWLDERLFGWTKSSCRDTYLWEDRGTEPGGSDEPHTSDSDDTGDYDDIFGLLRGYEGNHSLSKSRSRSGRSSYADLQQLRQTEEPSSPTRHYRGTDFNPGLQRPVPGGSVEDDIMTQPCISTHDSRQRLSPRERRSSLSENVPVQRIGELDREESFKAATVDINREASLKYG